MKIQTVVGSLLNTNNYIVGDDKNVVLIEASADIRDIKAVVGNRNVLGILLTHGHWDHARNIDALANDFKTKVYAKEEAFQKISSTEKQFKLDRPVGSKLPENKKVFLKEGEFKLGELNINVIFTPGHTDCSVCYLIKDGESENLFSGDTLLYHTCGRVDMPTSSKEDMKNSLKKLLKLDENLNVYPGHGFKTVIKEEKEILKNIL